MDVSGRAAEPGGRREERRGHAACGEETLAFHPGGPVGVLAIQGSFALHLEALERLGVEGRRVRKPRDLEGLQALILPGGESTVMSLLARDYGLFEPLRALGRSGFPMFGTCAGAILLGRGEGPPPRLEAAPVRLHRNAYGSQIDSFIADLSLTPFDALFRGVFIRAPVITAVEEEAAASAGRPEILGWHEGHPVLVAAGSMLLATFHPELTGDLRVHRYFLARAAARRPGARAARREEREPAQK